MWIIATAIYAAKALPTAGVPEPPFLITGDMCDRGKPDPEPYLRGAKALGLDISDCKIEALSAGSIAHARYCRRRRTSRCPVWRCSRMSRACCLYQSFAVSTGEPWGCLDRIGPD